MSSKTGSILVLPPSEPLPGLRVHPLLLQERGWITCRPKSNRHCSLGGGIDYWQLGQGSLFLYLRGHAITLNESPPAAPKFALTETDCQHQK